MEKLALALNSCADLLHADQIEPRSFRSFFNVSERKGKSRTQKISMKLKKYDDTFIASETITMAVHPLFQFQLPWTETGLHLDCSLVWLSGATGCVCACVCKKRRGDVYQSVGFCVHADLNNFVGHFLGRFLAAEAIKTIISKFV